MCLIIAELKLLARFKQKKPHFDTGQNEVLLYE